jgi:hypothetical protein
LRKLAPDESCDQIGRDLGWPVSRSIHAGNGTIGTERPKLLAPAEEGYGRADGPRTSVRRGVMYR